jgi:AcrR family transcriptional regulator
MQQNKHQQRTEATRRKLLNAALRIFVRDGFEAARIEDIAREAGHTRGAFYANFASKEDLFFALLQREANEKVDRLRRILEQRSTPEERMELLRHYYADRIADRRWVMLMLEFKLFAVRHRRLRARLAVRHRKIRSTANVTAIRALLPSLDPDDGCRAALEAVLGGLVLEHAYDPKRLSQKEVFSTLRQIFDLLMH